MNPWAPPNRCQITNPGISKNTKQDKYHAFHQINTNKQKTLRDIIVQLQKTKDKEKNLERKSEEKTPYLQKNKDKH